MKKADLHIHSNYSDGTDSLEDLVSEILKAKIDIFALTDHDTIEGCRAIEKYLPSDITFIKGVELTCESDGIECHVLGFGCDTEDVVLNSLIEKGKKLRRLKLDTRIKFLKEKWGIELTQNESNWLYSRKSVVKVHVANILVNRGLANDNLSAMDKYLSGCKCPNTKFTISESINAIKHSGGIPVWAHPLGGEGEAHSSSETFLNKLETMKKLGIQGLECYYSRYNFDEIEFLVKTANENGLLISGGSDYHGANKNINIGMLNTLNKTVDSKKLTVIS